MEKDIKDYRGKELKSYVIANFLAILYGTGFLYKIAELIGGNRDLSLIASSATFAVLTAVIYIFVFLADALVPSEVKDVMIIKIKDFQRRMHWSFMLIYTNPLILKVMKKRKK